MGLGFRVGTLGTEADTLDSRCAEGFLFLKRTRAGQRGAGCSPGPQLGSVVNHRV